MMLTMIKLTLAEAMICVTGWTGAGVTSPDVRFGIISLLDYHHYCHLENLSLSSIIWLPHIYHSSHLFPKTHIIPIKQSRKHNSHYQTQCKSWVPQIVCQSTHVVTSAEFSWLEVSSIVGWRTVDHQPHRAMVQSS